VVVFAQEQFSSTPIAHAIDMGRERAEMIDRLAVFASPTATQSLDDLLDRQIIAEHAIEAYTLLEKEIIEGFGLWQRPGKPIEEEPTATTQAGRAFPNYRDDQIVRDETTFFRRLAGSLDGRARVGLAAGTAEEVSCGKMA
jgi:hypothetical protein